MHLYTCGVQVTWLQIARRLDPLVERNEREGFHENEQVKGKTLRLLEADDATIGA